MKLTLTCLLASAVTLVAAQHSARYTEYINTYAPMAVMEMHSSGIPASITLAQGLLESGAGSSTLATQANNHFGIKCHGDWTGKSMYRKDDDRNKHGKLIESCFRSYDDPAQSYADHSEFLVNGRRYAELFLLKPTDYKGWAKGLKKAGYATSKTYASKLIELIESYELHQYDRGNFGLALANANRPAKSATSGPSISAAKPNSDTHDRRPALSGAGKRIAATTDSPGVATTAAHAAVHTHNDVKYTLSKPGETLSDIARRTRRYSKDLTSYNESISFSTSALKAGTRVYLQPKRKAFRGKKKQHAVSRGETMQSIADHYAIQTATLYQRNRMAAGAQPRVGESLYLRGRRPKNNSVRIQTSRQAQQAVAQRVDAPQQRVEVRQKASRPAQPQPTAEPARSTQVPASTYTASTESTSPARDASASSVPTVRVNNSRVSVAPPAKQVVSVPAVTTTVHVKKTTTVQAGDTLWAISRRTGVSVEQLRALNGLTDNTIRVGQQLRTQ